jgi:GDP-4-dehydro-6-deoxy-D-mannose reductase
MQKPRIVVSGVNGFVGHHLARELFNSGMVVIGIGTDETLAPDLSDFVEEYHSVDLTEKWPEIESVSGVIHLAGLAIVGPSFDNPQLYISANSAMVTNLCEYYIKAKERPRILIVSSGAIYNTNQQMPLTEESSIGLSSPYAVSKVLAENQAMYYIGRGLDIVVTRPFNHIGPGQGNGFILPDLTTGLMNASKNKTPLLVGNLKTRRDYTDVRDVVKAYRLLVTVDKLNHTIYNICSGESTSGQEILNQIQRKAHFEDIVVEIDKNRIRPNDPDNIYGDASHIEQDVGWKPKIKLTTTIDDYLQSL